MYLAFRDSRTILSAYCLAFAFLQPLRNRQHYLLSLLLLVVISRCGADLEDWICAFHVALGSHKQLTSKTEFYCTMVVEGASFVNFDQVWRYEANTGPSEVKAGGYT